MRKINVVIYGSTEVLVILLCPLLGRTRIKLILRALHVIKISKVKKIADEFNVKKIGISHDVKNKGNILKEEKYL